MLLDRELLFSDAQTVSSSPTTSTDLVDFGPLFSGNTGRDIGVGEELYVHVNVDTALTGASAAIVVTLETDDNTSFSSATTGQTIGTIAALSAAGTVLKAKIDPGALNERYARLVYTESGGTITGGALTAGIVLDVENQSYYASGFTVKD